MKTLQECTDQVSFEVFSVPYDKLLVLGSQLNVLEKAAKLYAQEACREQREICAALHHEPSKWRELIKNAPEPKI